MSAPVLPREDAARVRLPVSDSSTPARVHEQTPAGSRLLLAVIVLLAVVLRVYGAIAFPFDQDELYTFLEARDLFATPIQPGIDSRPLYYLLQRPLLFLLPLDEPSLRILPVLFGVAGVWTLWRFVRVAVGTEAGLVAAFLASVSPWHLYASTTARYYSLVFLLVVLGAWTLGRAIDGDRPRDYLLSALVFVVATVTHPTAVFPLAGIALGSALVATDGSLGWRWPTRRAWMWLWGPYAAMLITEVAVLRLMGRQSALANAASRGAGAAARLLPAIVEWMGTIVLVAGVLGALALLAGRRGPGMRRFGGMAVLALATTLAALAFSAQRTGVYADYAIGILPLLFGGAGALVQLVANRWPAPRRALVVAVACALAGGATAPSVASYLLDGMRFDYRGAYARITREAPGLGVLTEPAVLQFYYAPELRGLSLRADLPHLEAALRQAQELWVVASVKRHGLVDDDAGVLAAWVDRRCRLVEAWERPRVDYRRYRVELHRCATPERARGETSPVAPAQRRPFGTTPARLFDLR